MNADRWMVWEDIIADILQARPALQDALVAAKKLADDSLRAGDPVRLARAEAQLTVYRKQLDYMGVVLEVDSELRTYLALYGEVVAA